MVWARNVVGVSLPGTTKTSKYAKPSAHPTCRDPRTSTCDCVGNVHSARQRGVNTQKNVREKTSQDVQVGDVVSVAPFSEHVTP